MNLTQTAILTKRVVFFSIIFLVFTVTSFSAYKFWQAYTIAHTPPVEEKSDIRFGILQYPDFPKTEISSSNYSYSIDTQTGSLPKLGDKDFEKLLKVYYIPKPYSSFLSDERSKVLAQKFGIVEEAQRLDENNYFYQSENKNLSIDLSSDNFTFTNQTIPTTETKLDDEIQLISGFHSVLSSLIGPHEQLVGGKTKISYFQSIDDRLIPTNSRQDTDFIQISLWPKPIDGKPVYTPEYDKSLVNALVYKSADQIENYNLINFVSWEIDISTAGTYDAVSVDAAYKDLQSGKGIIVLKPEKTEISITNVYPGFYLPKNYSLYLIPIYVFIGPQFAAYVPALDPRYLSQPN